MTAVKLTTVTRTQGDNRALKDGEITPANFALEFEEVPVLVNAFRRMVRSLDFDVCEMAMTTYLCAREHGTRFTALPIFLVRGFHHGAILYNTRSGIERPKDLEGRRVGVNRGYTVTTGVWARGILQEQYGVDLSKVTWVLSGNEHVADFRPPVNVVPMEPGQNLADLVASGELAAAIGIQVDHPHVAPLIPDAAQAGYDALARCGHYPINHLMVVRDDLLARHPGLAADVFDAFRRAKDLYVEQLRAGAIAEPTAADVMFRRVLDLTGADPLPYGVDANRAVIEELISHAVDQRILTSRPTIDSLFADLPDL